MSEENAKPVSEDLDMEELTTEFTTDPEKTEETEDFNEIIAERDEESSDSEVVEDVVEEEPEDSDEDEIEGVETGSEEDEETVVKEDEGSVETIVNAEDVKKDAEVPIDDDEVFYAESDDKVSFSDDDMTIIQQMENVVSWEVTGLYSKDGKMKKKSTLAKKPPIFVITSSTGEMAEFVVSRDTSFELYKTFETIYKAYFGLDNRTRAEKSLSENLKEFGDKTVDYSKKYPVKFTLGVLLGIFFVVTVFIGLVNW